MSSTNKTTNYELSQFIGTDKPAWLADYNADMSKIDAQMKDNADGVTVADGKADSNATAIGTLANLTTTAKTDLVSAVNEVDSHADTAQETATNAATAAATANANIAKFNLTERSTLTPSVNKGTINESVTNVQFACDTTGSVFKVYGRIYIVNLGSSSGTLSVTIGQTALRPTTSYTINTGVLVCRLLPTRDIKSDTVPRNLTVNTDGSITLTDTLLEGTTEYSIMIPPCLYFNSDFGDQ